MPISLFPASPYLLMPACARGDALEVLLEHEVDHAGDAIGAIDGGSAAGEHVDPIDQVFGNGVNVYRLRTFEARDMAAAVNQHQRAIDTQIAQVEQVETGRADAGAIARVVARRRRANQRGQAGEEVGEVGGAGLLQELRAERYGRAGGRVVRRAAQARSGHHDFRLGRFGCTVFGRRLWRLLRKRGSGSQQGGSNGGPGQSTGQGVEMGFHGCL